MRWVTPRDRATRRRSIGRGDRGSALMLVPAGVLIVVLLGAVAVDLSAAHLAQRRLVQVTERAADDAAGMLDRDALRSGGPVRTNPAEATELARMHLASLEVPGLQHSSVEVVVSPGGTEVSVRAGATVRRLFGRGLPGVAPTYRITARATARLE